MEKGRRILTGVYRIKDGYRIRVARKKAGITVHRERIIRNQTRAVALRERERLIEIVEAEILQEATGTVWCYAKFWAEQLRHDVQTDQIRHRTAVGYLSSLATHFLPAFRDVMLEELTSKAVYTWYRSLPKEGCTHTKTSRKNHVFAVANTGSSEDQDSEKKTPLAYATRRGIWKNAKIFLQWALSEAGLPQLSLKQIRERGTKLSKRKACLSLEQVRALVRASECEELKYQVMILLGLCGALRFSELSALEWGDIDLEQGHLRIAKSQSDQIVYITKTESSARPVILPPEVLKKLQAYREEQGPAGTDLEGIVFPRSDGGYMSGRSFNIRLKRCARRAQIKETVTSHVLRRTTNNLIRKSAGEILARKITGHTSSKMTELYSDVDLDERRKVLQQTFGFFYN